MSDPRIQLDSFLLHPDMVVSDYVNPDPRLLEIYQQKTRDLVHCMEMRLQAFANEDTFEHEYDVDPDWEDFIEFTHEDIGGVWEQLGIIRRKMIFRGIYCIPVVRPGSIFRGSV